MKTIFNQRTVLSFLLFFSLSLGVSIAQTDDVVIVDSDFPNKGGLIASLPVNVTLIEAETSTTLAQNLKHAIADNPNLKSIHLFAPSAEASINLGGSSYSAEAIGQQLNQEDFQTDQNITVFVYSCTLAKSPEGRSLLENIASGTGFNVASSSNCDDMGEELAFDFSIRPLSTTKTIFD
ncbi:DUF4347 domain-containing protein [Flagellimonas oceanensis]|uniref:DUF4347 domain-containing protein n=1 Tax=Flagellimonas oceanensis TaxID=2499163 RepID=UPI000F8E8034|nr:DUF4347 domain-containing protein [Allomuricauda oceanensis]